MRKLAHKPLLAVMAVSFLFVGACAPAVNSSNPFKQGNIYQMQPTEMKAENVRVISNGDLLFSR